MNKFRLITVDATNTIFKFKDPPLVTYAKIAKRHNLNCHPDILTPAFKNSLKSVTKKWPHFGATSDVTSEHWWHEVIYGTFHDYDRKSIAPIAEDLYRYVSL